VGAELLGGLLRRKKPRSDIRRVEAMARESDVPRKMDAVTRGIHFADLCNVADAHAKQFAAKRTVLPKYSRQENLCLPVC